MGRVHVGLVSTECCHPSQQEGESFKLIFITFLQFFG